MKTKKQPTEDCLQCQGDEMLEVRKAAAELHSIMDILSRSYRDEHKPGTSVSQFVLALIDAEKDQKRLTAMLRNDAERKVKEIDSLIAGLRFVSDATKQTYSSGINLSGEAMSIQLTEIFRVAIHRIEGLATGYKGLLDGRQPQNQKDFVAHLMEKPA